MFTLTGFSNKEEKESVARFRKVANNFLQTLVPKEKMDLKGYLDEKRTIRPSVIIKSSPSQITLVNYITGSNVYYFANSIYKANMVFEMSANSKYKDNIKEKISLIDNTAKGYKPQDLSTLFAHLFKNTKSSEVKWSEKEKIKDLV